MVFSMKFAHMILSQQRWRSLWKWSTSTFTFAQLTRSWWDSGTRSWEQWTRCYTFGSTVRSASLCAALLSLCPLSPRQEGEGNAYLAFICCSYCKDVPLKHWFCDKNISELIRTTLMCWDEKVTNVVLVPQSLFKTGVVEELWQSDSFMVNIFNVGSVLQMSWNFQN